MPQGQLLYIQVSIGVFCINDAVKRGITPKVNFVINCRFKLIKWWAQSFLVGIPTIICGYRDDSGVVHSLEKMETLKIPQRAKVS